MTLDAEALSAIGRMAVEMAGLAGREMSAALGHALAVAYKPGRQGEATLRDPVSEVDQAVERLIRAHLAEAFPDHDVLGEEMTERPARGSPTLWALDPVDGTANFINGFPMFAGSVGVLHRGVPVAGAVWCASSHALRAGVYHAVRGGSLYFDGTAVAAAFNPAVRRRLGGFADASASRAPALWEPRRTGSAAIECAFVAAGLLEVARFEHPNVWDIAGGFALVCAAGGEIRTLGPDGWEVFEGFGEGDPATWRRPVVLGRPEAVAELCRLSGEADRSEGGGAPLA
ncbi:inositol monophosphatase family protein [Teichococcus aerofrigidensis]